METPSKVPVSEESEEENNDALKLQDEVKEIPERNNKFVPLWMPILAALLIVLAYVISYAIGLHVNEYRAYGVIGIASVFALACAYMTKKN